MKVSRFLKQPYPYYYRNGDGLLWKFSGLVFLFAFTFYYFFQPFDINRVEHKFSFFWISLVHAILPSAVLLIQAYVYWAIIKAERNWTIAKEFIFFGIFLLIVGTAQFLIRDLIYINPENWSLKYLREELTNTFLVGGIFLAIAIPVNFNRLYNKNVQRARAINANHRFSTPSKTIHVETQVKSENFELDISAFLFAKSDRNYLEIFVSTGVDVKKQLKRLTIKEFQNQIARDGNVLQTHRSYLVNLDKVDSVTGNAQGYKLTFKNCDEFAAVSRNRIQEFEICLKRLISGKT